MAYRVAFSPEAEDQLATLYAYIAVAVSPAMAERYVNAIIDYCESSRSFPLRGARRDGIRPGLRVTNYRGRAVIAFTVENDQVAIIGVFYGGQDYESTLQDDEPEGVNQDSGLG